MEYQELNAAIIEYYNAGRAIRELEDKANASKLIIVKAFQDANILKYQTGNLQASLTKSVRRSINVKEAEILLDADTFGKLAKQTEVITFRVVDTTKEVPYK